MILLKYYTKAQMSRLIPLFTSLGGLLLTISIILPRFFNISPEFDFFLGLCMGLSMVFNLFGLALLRWLPKPGSSQTESSTSHLPVNINE